MVAGTVFMSSPRIVLNNFAMHIQHELAPVVDAHCHLGGPNIVARTSILRDRNLEILLVVLSPDANRASALYHTSDLPLVRMPHHYVPPSPVSPILRCANNQPS